jgi:DNA repair protein RadC
MPKRPTRIPQARRLRDLSLADQSAAAELFRGTIDGASVHPREVVKIVLEAQSAAVMLVHNHPSQNERFSSADEKITQRLKEALALIDVRVVDHLFVAGKEVISFAEHGRV